MADPTRGAMVRRKAIVWALGAMAGTSGLVQAQAQSRSARWPNRPVRMVVGFPGGSFTDVIARILSERLSRNLGQPVVVDNKPGANGAIGATEVARANPDGYTLLMTNSSSITINPQIYRKSPYQASDFVPVTMALEAQFIVTLNAQWAATQKIRTAQDLIAYAKRNPGRLSYGSGGPGNIAHLSYAALSNQAGIETTHVPYKSSTHAQMAVLSGEIHTQFDTWTALPHIRDGKLLPIAVTSPGRLAQLPDIPTLQEVGFPGFVVTFWIGLLAPMGTPQAIVERLHTLNQGVLQDPRAVAVLGSQGEAVMRGSAPFAQRIAQETQGWSEVIQREALALD